jgi:4-amino-4-deoxy-L-arabinose transferase-like glycosyltransferase
MRYYKWIAAGIIAFAVVLAITSEWNDSIIVDEVPHIGAGYSYLTQGDMRLNPEHPPLAKDLGAFPLLFLNLKQTVFQSKFWQKDINGQWEFGRALIFGTGNDADLIRHAVKIPMILFFILSAIIVSKWSRRLYGDTGGLLALFLFSLSPTVLAHSRFVTTDLAALFGVLVASYFFVKYLRVQSRKNLIIAGLIFGVALLCKFSLFLLVPFLGLMAVIYGFIEIQKSFSRRLLNAIKKGLISILIFAFGLIVVVWPVYYFHTMNYPVERQHSDTTTLLSSYGNRTFADTVVWMSDKPVIRALGQYGLGLLMVVQRAVGGNTTYFMGETTNTGWHSYFPIVYFIKEPLAWWGLVIIAIILTIKQIIGLKRKKNRQSNWLLDHFEEFTMLVWLAIYWTSSIQSTLNIGVRHLLPVFPFMIILVSGQISRIVEGIKNHEPKIINKSRPIIRNSFFIILFVLLGWYLIENLRIYPFYLTYFNQVAGGANNGYKWVVDSNIDWGQDLVRFSDFVKANNVKHIEFDYFGWADPYYYLKDKYIWMNSTKYQDADDFKKRNQSDGWLAVSATFLEGSEGAPIDPHPINYKNWLQTIKPLAVIGHSIFVYRIQ